MKKRKRHSPEQIVKKLRDVDAMLAAGNSYRLRDRNGSLKPAKAPTGSPAEEQNQKTAAS